MSGLRDFTPARVGLRRAGKAIATSELLDFQLAHALARDAVHAPFDSATLLAEVRAHGWQAYEVHSAAADRTTYLKHPELGRNLTASSRATLPTGERSQDLAIVIGDGLSGLAVDRHAVPLLERLQLDAAVPIVIAHQARVAIGDDIGHALRASLVLVLIGERPGLTSLDSLGAYLTWGPRPGRTDAERYCVSNIRDGGLSYDDAAARISFLLAQARRTKMTGTVLGSRPQLT